MDCGLTHGFRSLEIPSPRRVGGLRRNIYRESEPIIWSVVGVPALIESAKIGASQHITGRRRRCLLRPAKNTITAGAEPTYRPSNSVRNANARIEVRPNIVPGSSPKAVCSELNVFPFVRSNTPAAILGLR